MKTMRVRSTEMFLGVVALLLTCLPVFARDNPGRDAAVSVCDLMRDWKTFHGKTVKVRAIYTEQVMGFRLYDPKCPQSGEVAVQWPPTLSGKIKKRTVELDRTIAKDKQRRAWVVVRGFFYGPAPYKESELPPSLPQELKEKMRNSHHTYGYMNGLSAMVKVKNLLAIRAVDSATPSRPGAPEARPPHP